ncbi:putative phage abortive infection protein [Bacillus sp. MUM 13]|uniref:putative phage abortive infection protein n=1 Tax=Bacillus sp. MUM 13 TaxID=1678001 RepID=UPI0008F576DD|nr:putative phage abortive infection protein [Bacillus sp. MUM 13]OIK03929.1 hypothetical protein BIV59_22355 [Bacillus sp. MUM 13]
MGKEKKREKSKDNFFIPELKIVWSWVRFLWVLPLLGIILVNSHIKWLDFTQLGPFGDFASGTLVPTLTFVSFLALLVTLRMQKEQLDIQKEEMQATRQEFIEQNKTLSIQRFENTFFQMVNLHHDIINSIVYDRIDNISGRASFQHLYDTFKKMYLRNMDKDFEFRGKTDLSKIRITYKPIYESNEDKLGHYFRNLYRILKFIDETDMSILNSEDKKNYIGIIRAQLSSYELGLIFYNSLSILGHNSLLLADKYNLFDNLNTSILISPTHKELFNNEASLYIKNSH